MTGQWLEDTGFGSFFSWASGTCHRSRSPQGIFHRYQYPIIVLTIIIASWCRQNVLARARALAIKYNQYRLSVSANGELRENNRWYVLDKLSFSITNYFSKTTSRDMLKNRQSTITPYSLFPVYHHCFRVCLKKKVS